ncbi:YcjX family protein [Microvirga sp. W0021]|uniref:YcjX family protein n=1 Tax=Hohaiivirga grylli TaxID=3133970 RepID=A0ABV0BKD8_9HYPH
MFSDIADITGDLAYSVRSISNDLFSPSLRLGVTGLSRSGKTVFTTALVHHLTGGLNNMPAFRAAAEGRIRRARLTPQPDDGVPRFPYEQHVNALIDKRQWPSSTTQISELRLDIEYERKRGWRSGPGALTLDIVDYPGEWILDLALIDTSYYEWSRKAVQLSRRADNLPQAETWLEYVRGINPSILADELVAEEASQLFKDYLLALHQRPQAVATVPPGRFLMPGDLQGAPALTFAPLILTEGEPIQTGSLAQLMERRFEAYKRLVIRPFFREHFQRIDRQIVLVDVLSALDEGPAAIAELEEAIDQVLLAFRTGKNSLFSKIFSPRAERVLFAATKADHIHHIQHDRLEAFLRFLVARAVRRTEATGARVASLALASVRATRETTVRDGRDILKAVSGIPEAGELVGDELFDGESEAVVFPGELPSEPAEVIKGAIVPGSLRFPRFRPPQLNDTSMRFESLPHIRLDRALEFLIGDQLI